ncbi:hypothetical protein, partial [Streptomyces sp. D2-8]|uniref:P-type ATPase n=1 Tax=Streptomyces sp. D2-8 TaxID=2707767 RepID=UPI0020BFA2D3
VAERTCMLFMNTALTRGRAEMVVTATGMRTEVGAIAEALRTGVEPPSPLQVQMDSLGRRLALVSGVCEPHGVATRCGRHDTHERDTPLGGLNTELPILRRVLQHGVAVAPQRLRALRLGWISITSRNRRNDRREPGATMKVGGPSRPASISDGRQVGALEIIRNKRLARVEVDVNPVGAGPELNGVWTEHGAGTPCSPGWPYPLMRRAWLDHAWQTVPQRRRVASSRQQSRAGC